MNLRETLTRIVLVALLLYSLASLVTVGRELRQAELLRQQLSSRRRASRP